MKRIAAMLMAVILPFTLALSGCGSTQSEVKTQMSNQTATPSGTQDTASQAPSDASDTSGDATGQKAKLTYLGRATVRIETAAGKVIYIDPYGKGDYSKPADIVLITHEHGDHNELSKVTQKEGCKVIRAADALVKEVYNSFDVDGVKIKAVPAYNKNHSKLNSLGYVLEFDGIKLYHAGDTSKIPEMADLAREKLQYALLPVDGVYNMDAKEASECAELIKAENYIPIHSDGSKDYNETNVADFAAEKKISVKPGDEIALN